MDNCVILLSAHSFDTHRENSGGFKPQRVIILQCLGRIFFIHHVWPLAFEQRVLTDDKFLKQKKGNVVIKWWTKAIPTELADYCTIFFDFLLKTPHEEIDCIHTL